MNSGISASSPVAATTLTTNYSTLAYVNVSNQEKKGKEAFLMFTRVLMK